MPSGHHGWWIIGLVFLPSGCAHPVKPACFEPPVLPAAARGDLTVDLSAIPKDARPDPADASYRELTEADCPCLAARASTLGNLLDQKDSASPQKNYKCHLKSGKASEQSTTVLHHAAD